MSLFSSFKRVQERFNNIKIPKIRTGKNILKASSKDELQLLQKELEIRGKIIEDIHRQLQNNLVQLIEKSDFANNLEKEFVETKTILKTKENDITRLREELMDRQNNPEYINTLLIKLYEELKQNKMEKMQKQQEIEELKREFEKKERELESLYNDLLSRNNIIQDVTQQLIDKQMHLAEKHSIAENIKENLDKSIIMLNTKEEKITRIQKELEDRKNDLETMRSDIELRNKIINEIKNQMIEKQHKFTEKNLMFNEQETLLKTNKDNIEQLQKELDEKEKNIMYRNNLISRQQEEITHLTLDLETIKQDIGNKKENILDLQTELKSRQNDLEEMKLDIDLRNKIINEIKNQMIENQHKFTEKNFLLNELDDIKIKLRDNRSALEMVENELSRRKAELETVTPPQKEIDEPWEEKLSTDEEIDKFLGNSNENLKTKKLDFEAEIDQD